MVSGLSSQEYLRHTMVNTKRIEGKVDISGKNLYL